MAALKAKSALCFSILFNLFSLVGLTTCLIGYGIDKQYLLPSAFVLFGLEALFEFIIWDAFIRGSKYISVCKNLHSDERVLLKEERIYIIVYLIATLILFLITFGLVFRQYIFNLTF